MSTPELQELSEIKEYVSEVLPEGFHLESVELTMSTLYAGQPPAFKVLISVTEEPNAVGYGIVHDIGDRIRQRWSRDDLHIEVRFRELEEETA